MWHRIALVALVLAASSAGAAGPQLALQAARSTESGETDVLRLLYRHRLPAAAWWSPSHLQLGAGAWRVPDLRGRTRRLDLSATPVWRAQGAWAYAEAGLGAYLLSHTINNDTHRLPSSLQFGSHVGVGLRLGRSGTLGIALQHLSNAGLKQPNGGIDLVLVQYTVSTGTPNW